MLNYIENPKVSVIIPAKNREDTIFRAISSVLSQEGDYTIEVIVVDDASTDNTVGKINQLQKEHENIFLIKNSESMGGAAARNAGAKASTGQFIAFLDSDDEWTSNHLKNKLTLLGKHAVDGCFGSFFIVRDDQVKKKENPDLAGTTLPDYLFVKKGDARTSTFVFKRESFLDVLFDDDLAKHQDWDLAIRFDQKHRFIVDTDATVKIYVDVKNRMSNSSNYKASEYFMNKHQKLFSPQASYNFQLGICFNIFRNEGSSDNFKDGMRKLEILQENNNFTQHYKYIFLKNSYLRFILKLLFKIDKIRKS